MEGNRNSSKRVVRHLQFHKTWHKLLRGKAFPELKRKSHLQWMFIPKGPAGRWRKDLHLTPALSHVVAKVLRLIQLQCATKQCTTDFCILSVISSVQLPAQWFNLNATHSKPRCVNPLHINPSRWCCSLWSELSLIFSPCPLCASIKLGQQPYLTP